MLDLGGWVESWRSMPGHPGEVVALNLSREEAPVESWAKTVVGDACAPPSWVSEQQFDLVYSNSLIEHVGGHASRQALAEVIHTSAPHHWVQTPYRYFPLEPHWLFPCFQFLPARARARISRTWRFGHVRSAPSEALADVLSVELLSETEMRFYFPRSELIREVVLGLTKSLIAVR